MLTNNVTANPLLLSLASAVNQLAGGRALVPGLAVPRMALGGVAQPLVLDRLRGGANQAATAAAIGAAVASVTPLATTAAPAAPGTDSRA